MSKALSRLGKQLEEAVATLNRVGANFALIGGLALAPHKVVRATQDVDFLLDANLADPVGAALVEIGYRCLHRNADAANYLRGDERLDFLYARRPAARQILQAALQLDTPFGSLPVVSAEGLIAFKLQGWVNDPRRGQDLEDIRALIRANRITLNMQEVRHCCRKSWMNSSESDQHLLSGNGGLAQDPVSARDPFRALDDLMQVIEALCPSWPQRPLFRDDATYRL